jgi:hypothetical protein
VGTHGGTLAPREITEDELAELRDDLSPLIGVQLPALKLSRIVLQTIEPSQVGTIVGTLMDASLSHLPELLPQHADLAALGLTRAPGLIGDREGYPDFDHRSGKRLQLKLVYVEPTGVLMKRPPTRREPSARITQKVTIKNVIADRDALLVLPYTLEPDLADPNLFSPTVLDVGVFSMVEAVRARDHRLSEGGGIWFGEYETPAILSRKGLAKRRGNTPTDTSSYGRKESEGHDYNEDTNFGKLRRIPLEPLQQFLRKHGASYAGKGSYPARWVIDADAPEPGLLVDLGLEDEQDLAPD